MAVVLVSAPQITVATSGTELRIVAGDVQKVVALYLSAPVGNTGVIFVGDAGVSPTEGAHIQKGTTLTISAPHGDFIDLMQIWVDAGTSGDKVSVAYLIKA